MSLDTPVSEMSIWVLALLCAVCTVHFVTFGWLAIWTWENFLSWRMPRWVFASLLVVTGPMTNLLVCAGTLALL